MTDGRTTDVKQTRKRVLVPPGKPEPKEPDGFVTPRGNDLTVEPDGHYGLYVIKTSHGTVPDKLSGFFTDRDVARNAIEGYLATYWKNRS